MSRSWLLFLDNLIAAAEKTGRLVSGRQQEWASDEAAFDATLFNLLVVGEAVKQLPSHASAALSPEHRSGPARLRDLIAHRDFAIDADIIWDVATTHVPALLVEARALRSREDGQG